MLSHLRPKVPAEQQAKDQPGEEFQTLVLRMRAQLNQTEMEIFAPAKQILEERGIQGTLSTIETKVATHSHPDVALAIIEEAKVGGYGTIVLGKRGRSMIKEFLLGGVTCKVIHHIKGCTIWVVE